MGIRDMSVEIRYSPFVQVLGWFRKSDTEEDILNAEVDVSMFRRRRGYWF